MRKKLVAGNWKMHGNAQFNSALLDGVLSGLSGVTIQILVCPPFPYLAQVAEKLSGTSVCLGAQNLSQHPQGAYTGEVAASMLIDVGCRYVLVGHSERRTLMGETDVMVAAKCAQAIEYGLTPILCVGESLAEREAGDTRRVIGAQVAAVLDHLGVERFARLIVAYEPVWAIGTGKTASPEQAQEVHAAIRAQLAECNPAVAAGLQIIYGGSVKPQTAAELFGQPDIDGGLIGGAALVVDDFLAICRAAS